MPQYPTDKDNTRQTESDTMDFAVPITQRTQVDDGQRSVLDLAMYELKRISLRSIARDLRSELRSGIPPALDYLNAYAGWQRGDDTYRREVDGSEVPLTQETLRAAQQEVIQKSRMLTARVADSPDGKAVVRFIHEKVDRLVHLATNSPGTLVKWREQEDARNIDTSGRIR